MSKFESNRCRTSEDLSFVTGSIYIFIYIDYLLIFNFKAFSVENKKNASRNNDNVHGCMTNIQNILEYISKISLIYLEVEFEDELKMPCDV